MFNIFYKTTEEAKAARVGLLLAALFLLCLFVLFASSCAASPGWHYESYWTNQQMPWEHSWESGHFVTCEVNDTTYVTRRCM